MVRRVCATSRTMRRARHTVWFAVIFLVMIPPFTQATAQDLGTLEPGKLYVAFNGDMPMSSLNDGALIGIDGEMISSIADGLGLTIVPVQMDWAAGIEAVTVGQVDLMIGAVGWTAERSNVMLLSEPIYYFSVMLAQKTEHHYSSVADMAGKRVGTVIGISLAPELKAVPDIGEVRLYDTSDAVLRDLVAGRIDIAVLDPPFVAMAIEAHPEWSLHQIPLEPNPAFPIMSTTFNAVFGIRKDAVGLADALNQEIAVLWRTCGNQTVMAKYGVTDASFFIPPDPNPRIGVDREEDWVSPTPGPNCDANATAIATSAGEERVLPLSPIRL